MMLRSQRVVYVAVLIAMFFWSFSFIWYKQVFQYYDPITLIVFRLIIAVPLLLALSYALRKLQKIQKKHLKFFLLLGFFEPFLYFLGECYGVNMISPVLASIMISIIPLLMPVPAWFIFRERMSWINFAGLIVSIIGVIGVIAGDRGEQSTSIAGILLMLLAVFSAVFHSIFVRKLTENYNSFTIVTFQNCFGLLYFVPIFMVTGFSEFIHMHHTVTMVIPVINLAVFSSTIAFLFFVYAVQNIGMAKTNVFINLIPVFTAILSFLFLKEKFTVLKICGIVVVIGGLVISQYNHQLRLKSGGK
jgi:drug/metabolite transporter (DMT)-like permease